MLVCSRAWLVPGSSAFISSARQFAAAAAAADAAVDGAFAQLAGPGPAVNRPVVTGSVLKRHGRDLTQEAADGRLDPLIGRHDVLERTLQILLRRTKNNPILIGDPGVGKTAVAEGIAQLIASPAAPLGLAGRSLVSLDVGSLVAGTQYRGAFEERLTSLLREVHMSAGRIILFIDELHLLMDAGRVEGGMNAANLLKPALARGDLHCIGATTVDEFRKHIEADGAFARRFQPVMVEEPTPEEAELWLRGLRGRYEKYHGVRFTDAALSMAVRAAQRYIPDRRLPDSAIDIIDEAAARARIHAAAAAAAATAALQAQAQTRSAEAVVQAAAVVSARPHAAAPAAAVAAAAAAATAAALDFVPVAPPAAWTGSTPFALSCPHCGTPSAPVPGSDTVKCARCRFVYLSIPQEKLMLGASLFMHGEQLEQQRRRLMAQQQQQQQKQQQQQQHKQQQQQWSGLGARGQPSKTAGAAAAPVALTPRFAHSRGSSTPLLVESPDVLSVVAEASGIPAEHLSQSDWQSLAGLEGRLRQRLAGQQAAVDAAVGAVRLGRLGLQRGKRPLASLLLTGPAGVGKMTLCLALAESLFGSERHLLRLNLAEFTDKASLSRLLGAPPGYVGYGEGGVLTDAVRRRPHSVVLLERADRAHPEALSLITQILEAGQLQDSMGKRCDFRNALLVLTTSPTTAPLPAGWGSHESPSAASSSPATRAVEVTAGRGGDTTTTTTTTVVPEQHIHPEAAASSWDSGSSSSSAGAHGAAAQCLAPEASVAPNRPTASGTSAAVHPLRYLPSELLSRLDAVVSMQPLSAADALRVVQLQLAQCQEALQQQGVSLIVSADAQRWLAERDLSSASGARRLQPLLREQLLLPIASALLRDRLKVGAAAGALAVATARVASDGSRLHVELG